ncbi:MAG: hypothetical protein ACOC8B_07175, partial [Gemmatimonadota bacterium]
LTLRLGGTLEDARPFTGGVPERSQFFANWTRRASRGLWYTATVARTGREYRPELGFLARSGVTELIGIGYYNHFLEDGAGLRRVEPAVLGTVTLRNADRSLQSGRIAHWWTFETGSGASGWIEPQLFFEDVREAFSLGPDADVPAGRYRFANIWLQWSTPSGDLLGLTADLEVGGHFDGRRTGLTLEPRWNASRHLELGLAYELQRIRFPARGQGLDSHLMRLRILSAWNARLSLNGFVQYSSLDDRLGTNLRLRYNFREGNDLWIVYDERLDTRPAPERNPGSPRSRGRVLLVKYTHTFSLGG